MLIFSFVVADIEAQIREIQARKAGVGKQGNFDNGEGVPLTASANGAYMDEDIYGHTQSKYDGYVTSIAANDDADADVSIILSSFILAYTSQTCGLLDSLSSIHDSSTYCAHCKVNSPFLPYVNTCSSLISSLVHTASHQPLCKRGCLNNQRIKN